MSLDGLRFRFRDEGVIQGIGVALTAGEPVPAMQLSEMTGLLAVEVAVAATVILWQATASPLTAFDFLYAMAGDYPTDDALDDDGTQPSLAGRLELTCNDGANERIWFEQLRAGCPYRRFSNVGLDSTSTADVIDLIRFVNNTTDIVVVRYLLGKI